MHGDKVAPVLTHLSESNLAVQGTQLQQPASDFDKQCPMAVNVPLDIQKRPIAAFSMVDIAELPEISPQSEKTRTMNVVEQTLQKDLELVLQVLMHNAGQQHLLRTLVDTGAKVPLIVKMGILTSTTAALNPSTFVTANGDPMAGGFQGATVNIKIPIALPQRKKFIPSAIVYKDQWVYEADIRGVDMIIGYPFLKTMHLVPIPSKHILVMEDDFIAMAEQKQAHPQFEVRHNNTKHGPPAAHQTDAPEDFQVVDTIEVPLDYCNSDWSRMQPWQHFGSLPATTPCMSILGRTHVDVPMGVKSVAGGFKLRTRMTKRRIGLLQPLKPTLALDKNLDAKVRNAWKSETYTVLDTVRDHICAFAGFQPVVDAFADHNNARCPYYWDESMDAFQQDWGKHILWINPPFSMLPAVVEKIFQDQASGIIVVPVWPSQAWFHKLNACAVAWWDLPPDKPIYMTRGGITIQPRRNWRTRAVIFNAFDMQKQTTDDWLPVGIYSVMDADNQAPGAEAYVERLKVDYHDVLFNQVYARDVDPTLRGPHGMAYIKLKENAVPKKEVPFRMLGLREEALKNKIEKSLANGWIKPCPAIEWGARAFVVPKPGGNDQPIPVEAQVAGCGPWHPVYGVKPTENSDEKFWRLVIDYRYLNSQTLDDSFPLPVIEDLITSQSLNNIWSLFDLQDGFHQMHLHPDCQPLTAFVTPGGCICGWCCQWG